MGNSNLLKIKKYSAGITNSGNLIIQGDNQLILNTLLSKYKGRIKCIYIDPPYNNQENYNHYDDYKDHKIWLEEVRSILLKLKPLLSRQGSIWISIDDKEMHYLKVTADEVFGRKTFINTIVWQQRINRENRCTFSNNHEYILVYSIDPLEFKKSRNLLPITSEVKARYKNPDNDPRGPWQSISANVQAGHASKSQFYEIIAPNGKLHILPNGRCWCYNEERMVMEINNNNIWFGNNGNGVPRIKKFLNGSKNGLTPETLWLGKEVGTNESAKKHYLEMFPNDLIFDTPKPEQLIQKILEISTNEGDLVLDCFLGSGTTAAVSHKMKRQYIGIEIGDHIKNCVVERLKKVIIGEQGGVSEVVGWKKGGGFDFYKIK